jgi:hypothetical protein
MSDANFEETILPRLVSTYEAGRLVPFIGLGMSRPLCSDWPSFVGGLESATGVMAAPPTSSTERTELIRRANGAVHQLKAGPRGAFLNAVRHALAAGGSPEIPPQTRALARLWWPLVLSTNYDTCYEAAFYEQFAGSNPRQLAVVGRGAEDCQRVLNSLSVAGRSLLWALQGYLHDVPFAIPDAATEQEQQSKERLAGQLVVGHEEYRRVTYRDVPFRRAFAEVFRQRSLLFLGSGLQEPYFQDLLGEVLEIYGHGTRPHYAFMRGDEVDADFMLARFHIIVVPYTTTAPHEELVDWLNELAKRAAEPRRTAVAWSWGRIVPDDKGFWRSIADVEIVRDQLPEKKPLEAGHCLAVSAVLDSGEVQFSAAIKGVVGGWKVAEGEQPLGADTVRVFQNGCVYAVLSRSKDGQRSLSHIYYAAGMLFDRAAPRFQHIHMQLLAAGGTEKYPGDPLHYPERFSLVQILRAWRAWRDTHEDVQCRLVLHVVTPAVYTDVASGRIDVLEILSCADVRFFVEIVQDDGGIERRPFQRSADQKLGALVEELRLPLDLWTMEVTPPPSLDPQPSLSECVKLSLQDNGVVPGSTLHFRRPTSLNE